MLSEVAKKQFAESGISTDKLQKQLSSLAVFAKDSNAENGKLLGRDRCAHNRHYVRSVSVVQPPISCRYVRGVIGSQPFRNHDPACLRSSDPQKETKT